MGWDKVFSPNRLWDLHLSEPLRGDRAWLAQPQCYSSLPAVGPLGAMGQGDSPRPIVPELGLHPRAAPLFGTGRWPHGCPCCTAPGIKKSLPLMSHSMLTSQPCSVPNYLLHSPQLYLHPSVCFFQGIAGVNGHFQILYEMSRFCFLADCCFVLGCVLIQTTTLLRCGQYAARIARARS